MYGCRYCTFVPFFFLIFCFQLTVFFLGFRYCDSETKSNPLLSFGVSTLLHMRNTLANVNMNVNK